METETEYLETVNDSQITASGAELPASVESDILSEAVGHIKYDISSTSVVESDIKTDNERIRSRSQRKARGSTRPHNKRGRKLGYRSDNTKDDTAVCGVCGGKVRSKFFFFSIC